MTIKCVVIFEIVYNINIIGAAIPESVCYHIIIHR
jgi:hypothetical protein